MRDELEWTAVAGRFAGLVADWELGVTETARLLGLDGPPAWPLEWRVLGADAEHRLRLLVNLDIALRVALLPGSLPSWLRDDVLGDGVTPLEFLSVGIVHIRAMHAAARDASSPGGGHARPS